MLGNGRSSMVSHFNRLKKQHLMFKSRYLVLRRFKELEFLVWSLTMRHEDQIKETKFASKFRQTAMKAIFCALKSRIYRICMLSLKKSIFNIKWHGSAILYIHRKTYISYCIVHTFSTYTIIIICIDLANVRNSLTTVCYSSVVTMPCTHPFPLFPTPQLLLMKLRSP